MATTMKTNNKLLKVYAHYVREMSNWRRNQTDEEITKHIYDVFRCSDGEIVCIEKCGSLAKDIWIGEGYSAGRTWEEAQNICRSINLEKEANFIQLNTERINQTLAKLDRYIDYLEGKESCISGSDVFYFDKISEVNQNNPLRLIVRGAMYWRDDSLKALNLEDAKIYRAALHRQKDDQIKRCNTYLKRYGTSKIHARTYWADR